MYVWCIYVLYVYANVHLGACPRVHIHMEATSQHWVSFANSLHLVF